MNLPHEQRAQEQQRVDTVIQELQARIIAIEPQVGALREQVVDIRKQFWDDVTVNIGHEDDALETHYSLRQQAELLTEREISHRLLFDQLKRMKRLLPSPYFGRIDFREDGLQAEPVYIGIASFLDQSEEHFLIYDWRTPIASLYYDYPPGPAMYETPGGTVRGEMELKRQFVIRDGRIRFMFDTGVTIGDDLLQEVLSQGSDAQMKTIVATIQREQNRIIRNDKSRLLIVQGAAGSGKTSAALQRVAYLLYRHRETLKADQMVLFSPNPMFNSYVSTVLPELGEENMQQTTFQEYLEHRLGKSYRLEDPFEQIEYILSAGAEPGYDARVSGIRFKASNAFLHCIQRYKELLQREGMLFRSIRFRDRTLISKQQMAAQFYSYDPSIRLANRVALMQEWLRKALRELEKEEWKAGWVQDEMDYLDKDEYQASYHRMRRRQRGKDATFNDGLQEEDVLRRMIVEEHFKPLRARIRRLRFVDLTGLYAQLFERRELFASLHEGEIPPRWDDICAFTLDKLSRKELSYEDATPFLYLKELVEGFQTNTTIRYVLIDEAQDFSAFQFEFIKRLFPRSRMTVLGDFNQAIFAHATTLSGSTPLSGLYGEAETEQIVLTRSYRSTREIVEFTSAMLPDSAAIEPFDRGGLKPVVTRLAAAARPAHLARRIRELTADGYASIAVICKTAAESEAAYEALKGSLEARLITKEAASFAKGVVVIPTYLAKGVEFDAVFIYDASRQTYALESERKLFYTACTRAMHRLYLYVAGEPSPLLADVPAGRYTLEGAATPAEHTV